MMPPASTLLIHSCCCHSPALFQPLCWFMFCSSIQSKVGNVTFLPQKAFLQPLPLLSLAYHMFRVLLGRHFASQDAELPVTEHRVLHVQTLTY